ASRACVCEQAASRLADAHRRCRLSLPELPAQAGRTARERRCDVTTRWNVSAVLLDMDGTLLDTEKVYFNSLVAALNASGYADDAVALGHAMVGLPGPACEAMLLDRYRKDFPLAEINSAFLANRDRFMEAGLPLKPGTLESLDGLAAADCPMAIVTSSSRRSAA